MTNGYHPRPEKAAEKKPPKTGKKPKAGGTGGKPPAAAKGKQA